MTDTWLCLRIQLIPARSYMRPLLCIVPRNTWQLLLFAALMAPLWGSCKQPRWTGTSLKPQERYRVLAVPSGVRWKGVCTYLHTYIEYIYIPILTISHLHIYIYDIMTKSSKGPQASPASLPLLVFNDAAVDALQKYRGILLNTSRAGALYL